MRTKKNRKFLKSGKVASLDFKFTGDEPSWHNCDEDGFYSKLGKCLNFYNYYLDRDDYVEIIQEYMKNNSYSNGATDHHKRKFLRPQLGVHLSRYTPNT
jgi:hypothetical protein